MASTVSSSSTYSTSASSNYGMSGLISGLDTEGLVESMLSGTQTKIDKQNAEKQQIIWKQEIYRDIISDINSLKTNFLSGTSSTNLGSHNFFNSMNAVSSSQAVQVTASSEAATGRTSVRVGQLATATRLQSGSRVSGRLQGSVDLSALQRKVVLNIGGKEAEVSLSAVDSGLSQKEQLEALAGQLNDQLSGKGVTAKVNNDGRLELSGAEFSVSAKSSQLGLSMLGVTAGQGNGENGSLELSADPDAALSLQMDLNGITRTITLDGLDESSSAADVGAKLQEEIDDAFGKGWLTVSVNGATGGLDIKAKGQGNIATMGEGSALSLLGMVNGSSNKIGMGQQLRDVSFSEPLQGGVYKFSINDVEFSFSDENTMSDVVKAINSSKAGVRVTYSDLEDKFTIESANTGAGYEINMNQTAGNLLNVMFGKADSITSGDAKGVTGLYSSTLTTDEVKAGTVYGGDSFSYGYFRLNVDGKDYSISIPNRDGGYTRDEVMDLINEGLANRFGYEEDGGQSIQLRALTDSNGNLSGYTMKVRNGSKVTFGDEAVYDEDGSVDITATRAKATQAGGSIQLAFGFNNTSNVAGKKSTLADMGLDPTVPDGYSGVKLEGLTSASTVEDLTQAVKAALEEGGVLTAPNGETLVVNVTFKEGRLVVETNGKGEITFPPFLAAIFGTGEDDALSFNQEVEGAAAKFEAGQNAMVTVNGVDLERSSNTFSVGGLTLSLQDTTGSYFKAGDSSLTVDDAAKTVTDKDGNVYQYAGTDEDGYYLDADGNRLFSSEETVTINTTRDTERIYEGLKSFVEQYNTLIEKLNGYVDAEATYRDYAPLTSAQKAEMSEREIELWEEKAKEGLLRNDSSIESFLSSMRSVLYSRPTGSSISLYNIGIETSSNWKDKGKLVIDESKLKSMIETNPQEIQELFTGATDGLAAALSKTIDRTASISSGNPGTLVELAGVEGRASSVTNTLTRRLISINATIKDLQAKYKKEKERYWKQFNAMESTLQSLNTQSSWLAQQFTY